MITEQFEDLIHTVVQKVEELQAKENHLESRKRDQQEQNKNRKHQILTQFEELRQKLDSKEREIMV